MKDYIEERVIEISNYIIETGATVREAAKVFKVSKSTVHKDVSERLLKINPTLWMEVKKVLEQNKAERHIRGGRATRNKYKAKMMENQTEISKIKAE
ncbi:MAG: sporulation transcriptional regulator SpoIIID [Caldicoprobacterales bacterium]|nr:sporulation transcriptional regulator SpoIIID [Clostridiales bacterium]